LSDEIGAGTEPVRLQLTPDRSRLLVTNRAQNNLQAIFAAPFWPAAFNPSGGSAPAGSLPLKMAASPDNRTLFVATRNDSDSQISDRLKIFQIVGETLTFRGEIVGPHYNNDNESFQIADIEPVDGDVLAVATNDDKIYMPTVTGGVVGIDNDDRNDNTTYMSLTAPIDLSDSVRDCVELVFQP
jgi:DNA-binding beta-propeller fold protein YncE